jgi:hypothetical protein
MSELDVLRRAMRTSEPPAVTLDLAAIMRDGRRLRIRRRLAGAGAAMLAVTSVAAVALLGTGWGGPPPVERRPPPVAVTPAPPATATPSATATPGSPAPTPVGAVVDTGIRYGADQRVYFFVPVQVPGHPRVTVGLAGGRRAPDGELTSDYLANDVEGSDRSRGFHQIGCDESDDPTVPPVPTFGYFVGPAERIVGTVDGRQVAARLARWSEDRQVVIFWFDPADLVPGVPLDGIVARDADNRPL